MAVECEVAVAGYSNEQEVLVASFAFPPILGESAVPMIEAVLPAGFAAWQNVTIVQDDPTTEALVADDFNATTHT